METRRRYLIVLGKGTDLFSELDLLPYGRLREEYYLDVVEAERTKEYYALHLLVSSNLAGRVEDGMSKVRLMIDKVSKSYFPWLQSVAEKPGIDQATELFLKMEKEGLING